MKKIFVTAFAAMVALSGCASPSMEQKLQAFNDEVARYEAAFSEAIVSIRQNAEMSVEEQDAALECVEDSIASCIKDYCMTTIKKNRNDSLGVEAFKRVYYYLDLEEQEEAFGLLDDKLKEGEFVQRAGASIAARKVTAVGQPFADFTVVQDPDNAESSTVSLSDYAGKGKYLLVDFWASWCGPCRGEIPRIKDVYERYAGDDFDVLSVAVWDKPEDTARAAAELGVNWHQIVNAQQVPTDLYGIDGIPHIILIGPDGIILQRDLRGSGIEEAVSRYVQPKH